MDIFIWLNNILYYFIFKLNYIIYIYIYFSCI